MLDRMLPVWIGVAMAAGVLLGRWVPSLNISLQKVRTDGISLPIALGLAMWFDPSPAVLAGGAITGLALGGLLRTWLAQLSNAQTERLYNPLMQSLADCENPGIPFTHLVFRSAPNIPRLAASQVPSPKDLMWLKIRLNPKVNWLMLFAEKM